MTHLDKGRLANKHGQDEQPLQKIVEAVRERARDGEISCAAAFGIAGDREVKPAEVGLATDSLEISIVKCQLGLFGYGAKRRIVEPAAEVSPELDGKIRQDVVDGRLPCAASWKIAVDLGLPKMAVSSACERLGIKISTCQLGAF